MTFKPGMNIFHHPTTLATICEPCPHPVWARQACASIAFKKHRFMPLFAFWQLTARDRRLAQASNMDLWSRRSKLLTNQVWSLELLLAWNGGRLKSDKKARFARSYPFLKFAHTSNWQLASSSYSAGLPMKNNAISQKKMGGKKKSRTELVYVTEVRGWL